MKDVLHKDQILKDQINVKFKKIIYLIKNKKLIFKMITFLNKKINKYYNIYLETLYFHKNKSQKYIIKIQKKN